MERGEIDRGTRSRKGIEKLRERESAGDSKIHRG